MLKSGSLEAIVRLQEQQEQLDSDHIISPRVFRFNSKLMLLSVSSFAWCGSFQVLRFLLTSHKLASGYFCLHQTTPVEKVCVCVWMCVRWIGVLFRLYLHLTPGVPRIDSRPMAILIRKCLLMMNKWNNIRITARGGTTFGCLTPNKISPNAHSVFMSLASFKTFSAEPLEPL